jgi:hypothetical protein
MIGIFSTREIATIIWLTVLIAFLFAYKHTRNSALSVIKVACSKQLVIPFVFVFTHAIGLTFLFSLTAIWKYAYIKDIAEWVLFAGVPTCFGAVSMKNGHNYFKRIVIDNLKLVVLVEFFVSTFTFNIVVEIVLIPILTILFLLDAIAKTKEEFKSVKKLMSCLLILIGLMILGLSMKNAINDYSSLAIVDTLVSFFIPLVLSILFLPVAYGFAVYAKYQMIFIRMSFKETDDKKIRVLHSWKAIKVCALSYSKLCRFEKECVSNKYIRINEQEFDNIINNFKTVRK